MKKILCLIVALMLLLCACAGETPETAVLPATELTEAEETEAARSYAPDFTMVDGEGNEVKLSDFLGKPVVLNFWASWCGPCKSEMPDFEDAFQEYGDEINFVMVNLTDGTGETLETAKAFLEEAGYSFPVYFDTQSLGAAAYGVSSIPRTYFIDADGVAVAYAAQMIDAETLAQGISMILE